MGLKDAGLKDAEYAREILGGRMTECFLLYFEE